jgi:hypothetical protein
MDFHMYFIGWMVGFGCASSLELNNGIEKGTWFIMFEITYEDLRYLLWASKTL